MTITWRVPGRIEVLGKHTDYAGGQVLVCAAGLGITAVAERRAGTDVVARSDGFPEPITLRAGHDPGLPAGHWGRYVQTVLDRLTSNFGPLPGAELTLTSDLPMASGMSSSSALVVASALALADLNGLRDTDVWRSELGDDRLAWASYLAAIENGRSFRGLAGSVGVGTLGGSEDHTAMLCSNPGELAEFGFSPVRLCRRVPWPDGWSLVVATSGVAAEKTGAAQLLYNRASLAASEALDRWNAATRRHDRTLADALRSDPDAGKRLAGLVDGYVRARVEHFAIESERLVPQGAAALAAGDLAEFGAIAAESQRIADTLLGNQVPQTIALAETAIALGARAACSFGAGFGGSVWAFVPAGDSADFSLNWIARYARRFPNEAASAISVVTQPASSATSG